MADRYKGKLTDKQAKFVEAYKGNAVEAAREAGYGGDDKDLAVAGSRNLKNVHICKLIQERHEKAIRPLIATRQDREKFLTDVMNDTKNSMKDRLKALELLSKMSGDYTNKIELSGNLTTQQQVLLYLPKKDTIDTEEQSKENIAEPKKD